VLKEWRDKVQVRGLQEESAKELRLRTLMPSILDKTFKGEL
jgi:hypothetical protein